MELWQRHLIKEALADLADAEYQARVWGATQDPEVGSLVETVEALYDDSDLGRLLEAGTVVFEAGVDERLRALKPSVVELANELLEVEVQVADPRMAQIRSDATSLLCDIVRLEAVQSRENATTDAGDAGLQ